MKRYRVDFGYGRYYFEPNEAGDWVRFEDAQTDIFFLERWRRESEKSHERKDAQLEQLRGNLSLAEEGLANYAQEVERLKRAQAMDAECHNIDDVVEIRRLRAALRDIAAYDPGKFRPLGDEIAIWRLATEALKACSAQPQPGEHPKTDP